MVVRIQSGAELELVVRRAYSWLGAQEMIQGTEAQLALCQAGAFPLYYFSSSTKSLYDVV